MKHFIVYYNIRVGNSNASGSMVAQAEVYPSRAQAEAFAASTKPGITMDDIAVTGITPVTKEEADAFLAP